MKIAVIGGGSTYTPELINGFIERMSQLPLKELWLMDISRERLEVVGGFAQRMVQAKGSPFEVHLTDNQAEAVQGASYVITQLRVGGLRARREDEYLGRKHGLVGQETTGIGGMGKALRTIPVVLKIAEDMRRLAPGAVLVNFTNPSGLVTEAVCRYAPDVTTVGVCNGPFGMKMGFLNFLKNHGRFDGDFDAVQADIIGLNHLSWCRSLKYNGRELWDEYLDLYLAQEDSALAWNRRMLEVTRMVPSGYLGYFYDTANKLAAQQKWPPSRAETVMEVEAELLRQYAELDRTEPPPGLMKRGGAYYSTVATQIINTHYNDLGEIHIANIRQRGAVAAWPADWVLEMPCRIDRAGFHPQSSEPLPPACFGLLAAVKMYELLTVEAAVHGDRKAAYEAMLVHPIGPKLPEVQAVLDDVLETHRAYLPQFWS
jgi:6-phospho-beta-glucosidase